MGSEEGLIRKYLELILTLTSNSLNTCNSLRGFYRDVMMVLRYEAVNAANNFSVKHYIDLFRSMKVILESAIQLIYYYNKYGNNVEAALKEVRRRSKSAVTFNIKMLSKLKNVHGQVKNEILKAYLKVSSYSHPTGELMSAHKYGLGRDELVSITREVTDMITYLILRICRSGPLINELSNMSKELGLMRTLKYLKKLF